MFNFRHYYLTLPMNERARVKKELMDQAEISETTFYRLVNGSMQPKKPLKQFIHKITNTEIYGKL